MQLQQLVERAIADAEHSIVVIEDSGHLVPFLGPLASRIVDLSNANGPVLRIGSIGVSGVEEAVRSAADGMGERDVLVLAMRSAPDRLPIGILVDTLTACGLWVVEAAPAPARGVGCALVVTRDDSAPWRSYLLGDTIPSTERSVLRLLAERAVEGLAVRGQVATLKKSNRERTRELDRLRIAMADQDAELDRLRIAMADQDAELDQLRQAMADREAELDQLRQVMVDREAETVLVSAQLGHSLEILAADLERVTEELRHALLAEREARQGGLMRQAARLVRKDPVHGSARVVRSVLRRTRNHGHAEHGQAGHRQSDGTSEIDDSSV